MGSVTLSLANESGMNNYTETDDCGLNGLPSKGQPFNLVSGQSCHVSILFSPLETCAVGLPPDQCPSPLTATLTVASPKNQMLFTAPITGTSFSGNAVLSFEPDFGAGYKLDARVLPVAGDHAEID